ncbi:MAG: tetratricopeptide repeat protein [Planctomycetales bacterium]
MRSSSAHLGSPPQARSAAPRLWLRRLVVIGLLTTGGLAIALWWEEWPLRRIERQLLRADYAGALEESQDYLTQFPGRERAQELRARALAGLERWAEAALIFDRIGAAGPESQRAWSHCLLHARRWSEALVLLEALHRARPTDGDILHELAACHGQLGSFDEAVECAAQLAEFPGQAARGRLLLGTLHNNRGNYRLAVEAWGPILDLEPEAEHLQVSPDEFFLEYGRALLGEGRAEQARPILERSLAKRATATAAVALGDACEDLGDQAQAVVYWKQGLALEGGNHGARERLARGALERNDPEAALQWLQPIATSPRLASSTAFLFQRAYALRGDKPQSQHWSDKASQLRASEQRKNTIDHGLVRAPQSFWSRAVRAHRFASEGNAREAALLVEQLLQEAPREPFLLELAQALQNDTELPSLDLIPMKQF